MSVWIAIGGVSAFGAVALLAAVLLPSAPSRLPRRMPPALRQRRSRAAAVASDAAEPYVSRVARRAVALVGRVPKPSGLESKLDARLDSAAWPLRANELLALQAACAAATCLSSFALIGKLPLAVLVAPVGALAPRLLLERRIRSRRRAFVSQLPETLQLLAGSLRAGYGLPQALDTVSREAHEPTSDEFARALSEARLGLPIEDALSAVADRVGSEDLRWVVMAVEIQRQVGGSLGELLESAAATMREREQIQRQARVLSAEGRLSAIILGLLPFALAAYLSLVNPQSLALLGGTVQGRVMLAVALAGMAVGAVWLRKIVRIKV